jgi:cyclophilin family peptidyl-prolyl cis-trans isomerase
MRLTIALTLLVLALAGCGSGTADDTTATTATTEAAAPATTTTETAASAGGCTSVETPSPKPEGTLKAPTAPLAAGRTYALDFKTNCGTFTVTLDTKKAPKTAASLVALAKSGFYDNLTFHRIVPGFVIQGGDPTGTGGGGPGYSTVDAPPADAAYTKGVVAMAKTGAEAPGTSGSQFFVVTGADVGLPPDYAIVGTVTKGLDVVERIGEQGDPNTEQPLQPIVIQKVTVRES